MIIRTPRVAHVPFTPAADQRIHGLEIVRAEIEQIVVLLGRLHSVPPSDSVLRNALHEALLLHVRAVLHFLESPLRSVTYAGGIRQENDDVLALDYGFEPERIRIPDDVRRELSKPEPPLSYTVGAARGAARRLDLLQLTLPLLRRAAAFATHVLESTFLQSEPESHARWETLRHMLRPFGIRGADVGSVASVE